MDDNGSSFSAFSSISATGSSPNKKKTRRKKAPAVAAENRKPEFTPELLAKGLSQLGRTAQGLRPAYLRLDVTGTDLSCPDALVHHKDLQTLVLPGNEISDLSSLQQLPNLTALDVSSNKLTKVLDFPIPPEGSNLRTANFSNNLIMLMSNVSRFSRLTDLDLSANQLESVLGIGALPMLTQLQLSGNRLHNLKGLERLPRLRKLSVQNNQIRSLAAISCLSNLEVLEASNNHITDLQALSALVKLQHLDVSHNSIHGLNTLAPCTEASLLGVILVAGNPVCQVQSCRLHLVHLLPQVAELDGRPVTAEEKVLAANMHGADASGLTRIRRKYFPDGELDDGGGAIPPPSAGLIASCAEEEAADTAAVKTSFIRLDAWARSVPVPPSSSASDEQLTSQLSQPQDSYTAESDGRVASPRLAGAALLALASQLSSTCSGQLQQARVCLEWVASHLVPPTSPYGTECVESPLFQDAAAERLLMRGLRGTWSERAATVFALLAKACELEAVVIPGYCKRLGLKPGDKLAAHNHCWAGVKVGGRWRLVDPALSATIGSGSCDCPDSPFFVPPEAWIYCYLPLEAHWQLLAEPVSMSDWWDLPLLSLGFFSRGMKLLNPSDWAAVNTLPCPKEGGVMPCLEVCVAAPQAQNARLLHTVRDSTGQQVAVFPQGSRRSTRENALDKTLAYQQVEYSEGDVVTVGFGAHTYSSRTHRLVTSMPAVGEYTFELHYVSDLPGGLPVQLEGLDTPLVLRIHDTERVMQAKVVVPEVWPHDPEDGLLHSTHVEVCPQPVVHPHWHTLKAQLVSPPIGSILEADRPYTLHVIAPGGTRLGVSWPGQQGPPVLMQPPGMHIPDSQQALAERPTSSPEMPQAHGRPISPPTSSMDMETVGTEQDSGSRPPSASRAAPDLPKPTTPTGPPPRTAPAAFQNAGSRPTSSNKAVQGYVLELCAPRAQHLEIVCQTAASSWVPVLTIPVAAQSQHIIDINQEPDVPHVAYQDPRAGQARDLFSVLDINADGKVTRAEMLVAMKRNQQLADALKLPHLIRAYDGTLDRFYDRFQAIDTSKLGLFNFDELCLHLGIKPTEEEEEGESEYSGSEDEGELEEGSAYEGDSRPGSPDE